ncbi:Homoserine/homoserine lactone efflux protein [Aliiroseovarius pelagivivens]|uniref:Homoserine/homoserine lactone efflux protein n=1 Tax=Aliiroseovarius pelagivivens TaxID=1639690 RepID=A0A2R8ASM7_9RHOB|nr:LysE family translocator [Aliiroseovarius pelagivivens]SPF78894.1 Homoserine/homoserine lactone efflux protein [Aliiroseovarius pelagivivens]
MTLGLCLGLLVHTLAVTVGLAAVVQTMPSAFTALKTIGAAYLVYLAWGVLRAGPGKLSANGAPLQSMPRLVGRGLIMNLSNPKVAIFMLAFLPQFVDPTQRDVEGQLLVLGLVITDVTMIAFGSIALLSSLASERLSQSQRTQTLLQRSTGIVFLGLAANLISSDTR